MVGGPQAGGSPEQVLQGILGLGEQIEKTLMTFAQAMPEGAKFFQEANELVKQGIAAAMSAAQGGGANPGAGAPAVSPTNAGPQFPGGGFASGA